MTLMAASTCASSTPNNKVTTPLLKKPPVEATRVTRKLPAVSACVRLSASLSFTMTMINFMAISPDLPQRHEVPKTLTENLNLSVFAAWWLNLFEAFHRQSEHGRASNCHRNWCRHGHG